jgi:phospholipid/cholesterol/gamma-HCH transport system substrate-binding protein
MPQVRADLEALARTVGVVDEVAPQLLEATEDGLVFLDSLVRQEAALTSLITGGTGLAEAANGFLSRNRPELVAFIRGAGGLVDVLYDNRRAGITDAMTMNIVLGDLLPRAVRHGFQKTDGILATDLPPYYGPDDRPTYGFRSMVESRERSEQAG